MKKLEALRDELRAQIGELQQKLAGVEMAIRALSGEPEPPTKAARTRAPRSNVKQYLLNLLEEARDEGLNAGLAVQRAEKRGEQLERGTVSSLLSRFKADGVVKYDGQVYRLAKYAKQDESIFH